MKYILLPLFVCVASFAHAVEKPNIVFILADDLGIGDVKCYGGDRCLIDTPNIDALAARGLRFTDAHANASICGPTRRAIMTGRYNWRFGATTNNGPWGFVGPRPGTERSTLGKLLKRSGYQTGYVGKWHLGTTMATRDGKNQGLTNVDFTKPLRYGPVQFGFDESFILPGSLDMYPYAYVRNNVWQGNIAAQKGWSAFNRVGPSEKDFEDHEVLETFFDEADALIGKQSSQDPFFLFLALTAPHTPTSPGVKWQGKSKLGVYGDFVMEVDHAVERVVTALKKQGLYDNTLILFSSDHGPASYAGNILKATPGQIHQLEEKGHHSNGLHRGYKFSVYEGGLHVPLIAHWPETIKPERTSDALVGLNDLMATFADIAETKIDPQNASDSLSFANVLKNNGATPLRKSLLMQSAMEVFVVRDGPWKLCLGPGSGAKGIHGNRPLPEDAWKSAWKSFDGKPSREAFQKAPFVQLFNLSNDPHEDNNLAGKHPERVSKMVGMLQNDIKQGRSTPGPKLKNTKNVVIHQRLLDFVRETISK